MLQLEPRVASYLQALKGHFGDRRAPLRRLLSMLQEYPREAFLSALASAERYRLFDLDRLEKIVLRQIAAEYFVLTLAPVYIARVARLAGDVGSINQNGLRQVSPGKRA
jgi:hypothetical protein